MSLHCSISGANHRVRRIPVGFVIAILFAASLAGCASDPVPDLVLVPPLIRELHGDENLRCLIAPERVASFRVSPVGDKPRHMGGDYRIEREGPDLNEEQIRILSRCLIDMRGYSGLMTVERRSFLTRPGGLSLWGGGCAWVPGVVFAFHRGDRVVRIVLCFNCGEWAFEADGSRYEVEGFSANERTGGVQPALRWLAVNLFPEDEKLKQIPLAQWW